MVLLVRFIDSVSSAVQAGAGMGIGRSTLERLGAVLDEPPFPQPAEPKKLRDASVEFTGVGFRYDVGTADGASARPVLNDVTFRLAERGMTALVGPSGAGKTMVAALIARFRDTAEGTVRIGGVGVREIAADDLAAHVSLVFRDVCLFDGTIEENVRIAAPDAAPGELSTAAALSGLDRAIAELPDGWDTKVGEGGARLAGGQRRLVSIARALLKDAPILVLDEAAAALDQENEALFAEAVRTRADRKTLLVIAYRLSTVVHADQILVLEDGEITERGTHDDLVTAGGTYASFWQRRARARRWRLEAARS
ncbi:ABC transporter ATP-binding protein [Streptomyces sp. NPDC017230]|uniref:ABC transporter ATP-binding protein n=1 Tax=unclassified Streptomyces TaxID=2593676 RepID=UPI0037B4087C